MSRLSFLFVAVVVPALAIASVSSLPNVQPSQQAVLTAPPPEALLEIQRAESLIPKPPTIPKFDKPSRRLVFGDPPTDREIILARLFEMNLVPENDRVVEEENVDLARALMAFGAAPRNVSPLTDFLDRHPDSRWKASLLANLGLIYFQEGYWSKTMPAWQEAWSRSKKSKEQRLKAIADRSLGELALMYARLGRLESLKAIRAEATGRDIRGPGFSRFDDSMEGMQTMEIRPDVAFYCGPMAVCRIFQTLYPTKPIPEAFDKVKSTTEGTDMATLQDLTKKIGVNYQVAFRKPGAEVLVPSIVNWKVGHFAALTKEIQGAYLSQDHAFGIDALISREVLDAEASGYFMVREGPLPEGWRTVNETEARNVRGKGTTGPGGPPPPPPNSPKSGGGGCGGMAHYSFDTASVSLVMTDTPVGYTPPVGPAVQFTIDYNQREAADTSTVSNLGYSWCFSWLAYIQAPSSVSTVSFGPDGGQLSYANLNTATGAFGLQILSEDTLVMKSATSYELDHPDGSKDIYDLAEPGSSSRIFRTKKIDRFGNALTYAYDSYYRLQTVADAIGQTTVIYYRESTDPTNPAFYYISLVTDPFGRSASFTYNSNGQLVTSTDVLGITSTFTYGFINSAGQTQNGNGIPADTSSGPGSTNLITSLTTPYGTTTFTASNTFTFNVEVGRTIMATDPLGGQEMLEWANPAPISDSEQAPPAGFVDQFLEYRSCFYWDKKAMQDFPGEFTKARITHFLHDPTNTQVMSYVVESTKEPYENRVWRAYAGQISTIYVGTDNQPSKIARTLDDGTEQDYTYQYNAVGNITQAIDPVGREKDYAYDPTNLTDLLQVSVKNGSALEIQSSATYNGQHLPLTVTDASGQTTTYTYNSAGQMLTATDPKGEITTSAYSNGYLQSVTGPVAGAVTTFTYDLWGRVNSVTDSEGYTVTTLYDAADRPVQVAYPDGTTEQTIYTNLDAEWTSDRLGRWTRRIHDALQHLVVLQDPLLRRTSYDWCTCGNMVGLIDPNGNRTAWVRDAQSRLTQKTFPDGTSVRYTYENTTSRLKLSTDAVGQITQYVYYPDNLIKEIFYDSATIATPSVSYAYDPAYPRIATMVDGVGTSTYAYNPITPNPSLGAGRLASITGPIAGVTVSYGYDQLGRVITSAINGASNTTSTVHDALGRVTSVTNPLGQFTYEYVDTTNRISSMAYPNGQVTNYSYYPNSAATPGNDDQRLEQITNTGVGGSNLSTLQYSYDPVGKVTSWNKQLGTTSSATTSYTYDATDQLIAATMPQSTGATDNFYGYDPLGNRIRSQTGSTVTGSSFNNVNQLVSQAPSNSMVFSGTVSKPVTMTVGGNPVTVSGSGSWIGSATVSLGANSIPVVATDANGNSVTKTISVTVTGGQSRTLSYDLDGNLTNNGAGQTYLWDAANRLVGITQSSGANGFVYDGAGRRTQETLNGTVIKQWIWCGSQPCEELDGAGNVTKMFFSQGEQISGINYFYTRDHLGSVREMTDSNGTIHAQYDYDPYGNVGKLKGDLEADFQFTGDYFHKASGLNLTLYRAYDPVNSRWLSRDPMGEYGGLNLYGYVRDNPVNMRDPLGLCPNDPKKKCGNTDPMSSSAPNPYSPGDNYLGVDAGMMFSIGGNNSWGQLVRSCLVCMLKGGASMGEAHSFCYLNSEKRVGFWRGLGGFLYAVGAAGATAQYQSGPMPNPLHP